MGATGGTKVLLLVLLVGWEEALGLNWNPVPRKTVRYQGESAVKHPLSDELYQLNLHNCSIGWFYRSSLVTQHSHSAALTHRYFSIYSRGLNQTPKC